MKHDLKITPQYFEDVLSKKKTFELRKDDRDFNVNDVLWIWEYKDKDYTGRILTKVISYVLRDVKQYGLMDGYVILGII